MSDKNLKDEQNTAEDAVIADDDLENVAGGIIDGGCVPTRPSDPIFGGGGGFGGGGASGGW